MDLQHLKAFIFTILYACYLKRVHVFKTSNFSRSQKQEDLFLTEFLGCLHIKIGEISQLLAH